DVSTGKVSVLKYFAVSDSGRLINPLIVEGQVVGGIVHGIGNALLERLVYSEEGQLISSTFMDYHLPCSTDAPPIQVRHSETPTVNNPLGARGAGEGGVFAAVPSIINAIEDALRPSGVRPLIAPVTPERLWHLLKAYPR
ncbi:MAG: molybdopterin cofactor-binding domain-containing protein, partial [Nitrososphaerales archaeon]